ncbi:N-acetylmuramidase domain-containing protein [Paraburkholderia aromaticivorans]|uniref:N-acetylmuramidase domain-containing protein n=1 Tax=Paraburkholderia aromaticivorans TaxID=2026199 RepID=UPI001455DC54|nr:N-acetylmuramidase domain-containing protein [Paraburkholderia aromaticivorans]
MSDTFLGTAVPLTQAGFDNVTQQLGADAQSLWALLTVETQGFGFLPDRRPKILYERHIFSKRTGGRYNVTNPDVSSSEPGGYLKGAAEYERLMRAIRLDRQAALESTSWGLPQIMGFNAKTLRYLDAEEMIQSFINDEDTQLQGANRFISNNAALSDALRQKEWARVAFFYNGKDYQKNQYDRKLQHYYELFSIKGTPSIEVRAAQARLTYLGFDPGGIDGVIGNGTRTATIAFQRANQLSVTADLDDPTLDALKMAAGV